MCGRAGFKGGQTGQLPRASTTRGPHSNSKNYYIKILFETDNLEKKYDVSLFI